MKNSTLYAKIILNIVTTILIICFCIFLLPKLLSFFLPFVIGWIIAMIANPLVRFLEKKVKIVRKHSSAIIIILVLGAVVGVLYFGISVIVKEVISLYSDFPNIMSDLQVKVDQLTTRMGGLSKLFPDSSRGMIDNMTEKITNAATEYVSSMKFPSVAQAGNLAKNVADGFFVTIITLLSAYFFIADRDRIVASIRRIMPNQILSKIDLITDNFKKAIGGYFKAQFKIMLVIVVILFVGFSILRVDYAFLLALAVAFLDLLPFFGTGAVLWPWAAFEMISGRYSSAIFLMVVYLICQVVKQVLQPKMVGDSIGITPLSTLIFMFIGYRLGGVIGIIVGIPVGMIIVNFYKSGVFDDLIRGTKILLHDFSDYMKF